MSETTPKADVQKAPLPQVDRVEELASRVLNGDILLPRFQRDFVWSRKQIIDLWDSIINNYPIGSVLLWRSRDKLSSERSIADLTIGPQRIDYPVNYLLDGQQRLSSVCGALYWQGDDPESQWNVVYDLRKKQFFHTDTLDTPPDHQIRLNWLSDPSVFFSRLQRTSSEPDGAELYNQGALLFNRLKDYKIATVTLLDMPIQDVGPIFERINSRGTPLTIVDLMRAATWSDKFDLFDEIDSILKSIDSKGFGGIERKVLLRSLSAAAGGGFSEGSIDKLRDRAPDALKQAAKITYDAYQKSIDFLSTELKIPSDKHLPYVNQIVVLTEIFRQIDTPTPLQLSNIKKWFWRTAISSYFSGWNTGNMAADQEAAGRFARGETIDFDYVATDPTHTVWLTQQFRSNTAHSKVLSLILAYNHPIDLLTAQVIDTDKALHYTNSKEYHHFFPRDFLASRSVPSRKINALANFVMLTAASNKKITNKPPSIYLKEVEATLGDKLNNALETNLISETAYKAAKNDDYETFLNERAKTIHEKSKELTAWP